MINGVNDHPAEARGLVRRLNGTAVQDQPDSVQPVFPERRSKPQLTRAIYEFQKITRAAWNHHNRGARLGVKTSSAACGQLVGKLLSPSERRRTVQRNNLPGRH